MSIYQQLKENVLQVRKELQEAFEKGDNESYFFLCSQRDQAEKMLDDYEEHLQSKV